MYLSKSNQYQLMLKSNYICSFMEYSTLVSELYELEITHICGHYVLMNSIPQIPAYRYHRNHEITTQQRYLLSDMHQNLVVTTLCQSLTAYKVSRNFVHWFLNYNNHKLQKFVSMRFRDAREIDIFQKCLI